MRKLPIKKIIGERQERCLYCSGTKIIRKGKRRKKFETVQLWYCKDCDTVFAPRTLKGKTYPIPVILDGLAYYYTGHPFLHVRVLSKLFRRLFLERLAAAHEAGRLQFFGEQLQLGAQG